MRLPNANSPPVLIGCSACLATGRSIRDLLLFERSHGVQFEKPVV